MYQTKYSTFKTDFASNTQKKLIRSENNTRWDISPMKHQVAVPMNGRQEERPSPASRHRRLDGLPGVRVGLERDVVRPESGRRVGRDGRLTVGIDGRVPVGGGWWEGLVAGLVRPGEEPVEEEDDWGSEEDEDDDGVDEATARREVVAVLGRWLLGWKEGIKRTGGKSVEGKIR